MEASLISVLKTAGKRMLRDSVGREGPGTEICWCLTNGYNETEAAVKHGKGKSWQTVLTGVAEIDNTLWKVIL
jgi:hypothetical protein